MHKKTYYYVAGNTAEGFVNYLPSNVQEIDHIITLNHPSNPLKTELLNKVIDHFEKDYDLEIIHSSFGEGFLDGVIIRSNSLAFITDTILMDEIVTDVVDLEQFVPIKTGEDPTEKQKLMHKHTISAYENFATGLEIHDELEAIFINEMDFKIADVMAERFIIDLLYKVKSKNREVTKMHRLFGTNTPEGALNIVPELLQDLTNCYFLKGRAGTGKSTFMKKVAKACEDQGLDMEIYHCSFDPNSIDMVLVRDLRFCIFDSTDPHEFFPERDCDGVIDLYEDTVTPGTDEKYAKEIQEITRNYKAHMQKGIQDLKNARYYQFKWEQMYPFDHGVIDLIIEKVLSK